MISKAYLLPFAVCVCLSVYEVCVCVCTVPLFRAGKIRRHLFGDSELAVKNRKVNVVGERKKKNRKHPVSPEIYLFWLLACLKLPVGDFKMAPLAATDWALPCQNVFEWKIQAEKFPPFSLFLAVFLPCSLVHSSSAPPPLLSILHRTQKGHLFLYSEALIECCLCS